MRKEWIAFACAVACLIAIPIVVNALACKLGRTLDEEHRIRAFLYSCANGALIATIFCLWLLGGNEK